MTQLQQLPWPGKTSLSPVSLLRVPWGPTSHTRQRDAALPRPHSRPCTRPANRSVAGEAKSGTFSKTIVLFLFSSPFPPPPPSSTLLSLHFGCFPPFVFSHLPPCLTLPLPCSGSNLHTSHLSSPPSSKRWLCQGSCLPLVRPRELQSSCPRSSSLCPSLHIIYTV